MERFIKNLARGAGAILREGFGKEFNAKQKSDYYWDIVTEHDLATDKFITDRLKKRYPSHDIVSEESGRIGRKKNKKNFWLIDPLDATHAFSRGLAQFSVSIAFVSDNQIKSGAVYDPIADELFFAERGRGAKLNNKKIFAFRREDLNYSILSMTMGSAKTTKRERQIIFDNAAKYGLWLSRMESVALTGSYVACGRYDTLISKNLASWDYAAAGLILTEAGAKVTDFKGRPYRWNTEEIVAANPVLHKKVIEFTRKI